MTSFKQLRERAKRYGLTLWESGGYYYLSGIVRGEHIQDVFTNLRQIEKQLKLCKIKNTGIRVGSKIRITSDNENYDRFRDKIWKVESIARSTQDHPGYDNSIGGKLISCKGLPFSLYEYEFEVV